MLSRAMCKKALLNPTYHLGNVESIQENAISLLLNGLPKIQLPKDLLVAGGNTRRLNFEYQAFVLALHRTLEYFAVSMGAFFKCKTHRIRILANSIKLEEPQDIRERVQSKLEESLKVLPEILSLNEEAPSKRDILAHWKNLAVGTLHIWNTSDGFIISFVVDKSPWNSDLVKQLRIQQAGPVTFMSVAPILHDEIMRVENLILGVYSEMGLL